MHALSAVTVLLVILCCADVQALKEIQGLSDDMPDTNKGDVLF